MEQGYLELITGTMFSGKSTKMINKLQNEVKMDKNCLWISPTIDTRSYFCHNKEKSKELDILFSSHQAEFIKIESLPSIDWLAENYERIDTIFIDEGQFFENIWLADEYAQAGYTVYVCALLFTSEFEWFTPLIDFYPCVDKVEWCNEEGYCSNCKEHAKNLHTVYLGKDGTSPQKKTNKIEVGGNEKYGLLCRKCLGLLFPRN